MKAEEIAGEVLSGKAMDGINAERLALTKEIIDANGDHTVDDSVKQRIMQLDEMTIRLCGMGTTVTMESGNGGPPDIGLPPMQTVC